MSGKYQLIRTEVGPLHYLDGQPLRDGDPVCLQLADGSWISGVYQWSGEPASWPVLRVAVANVDGAGHTVPLVLNPDCVLERTR